ncbi:MAG TPA: glycosyltransferase [Pontimonas sp.]|nr:glycosyltransferase [Pontimonas sp.]
MTKSVTHISFSSSGGAGTVAHTLTRAQRESGRDAQLAHIIDSDLRTTPLRTPLHTLAAGVDHYVVKASGFAAPISLFRDRLGTDFANRIATSDVIHLHGYNGAVRLEDLARVTEGRRVVWTLHDMNPFTGVCHYSLGCQKFTASCESCPAVRSVFHSTVRESLMRKISSVKALSDLRVVAPSTWLANEASRSVVFRDAQLTVIPNPVPFVSAGTATGHARANSGGDGSTLRACAIAKNLSDPVKNVAATVRAFHKLRSDVPDARLRLIGQGGEEFVGPGIELLGPLDSTEVARELQSADILIVSSRAENTPLVIIEAASQGCLPVVSEVGGMPGMIEDLGAGEVFSDESELVRVLARSAETPASQRSHARAALEAQAQSLYGVEAVLAQYDTQYD